MKKLFSTLMLVLVALTVQAQILELLKKLTKEKGTSVIMITHDLGVVASMCDRIAIMYAGQIVEEGTVDEIFYEPHHPYTKGLLNSINNSAKDNDEPFRFREHRRTS